MYLVYNIYQVHWAFNEPKKNGGLLINVIECDRKEY